MSEIVQATIALLYALPGHERQAVLQHFEHAPKVISRDRAGDTLIVVQKIIPRAGEWSMSEVIQAAQRAGMVGGSKRLYNAVSYLQKRGNVRRIGYGRYLTVAPAPPAPETAGEVERG